jgi:hypothetical protein
VGGSVTGIGTTPPFLLLLAALALGAGCDDDGDGRSTQEAPPPRITQQGLVGHLTALQRIADQHDGERAAGTAGYDASVDYVTSTLRKAGWRVQVQPVPMTAWRETSPASLSLNGVARSPTDFRVPSYSAAGAVSGALEAVDDACEPSDFDDFQPGQVAFTGFGECFLWRKTVAARRAGARALVVQTKGGGRESPAPPSPCPA